MSAQRDDEPPVAMSASEPKSMVLHRLMVQAKGWPSTPLKDAMEFRRKECGLTQREFAQVLGIYETRYSEFVRGKRDLPVAAMRRAYAIGIPADVLLQPKRNNP